MRALAELIACDIHPLNNTSPLRYLKNQMHQEQSAIDAWYHHWVITGFEALEALIEPGPYACGDKVTLADLCLVPQVNNARRLKVPLDKFPKIVGVDAACLALASLRPRASGKSARCGVKRGYGRVHTLVTIAGPYPRPICAEGSREPGRDRYAR